jgi:hypothetical protein
MLRAVGLASPMKLKTTILALQTLAAKATAGDAEIKDRLAVTWTELRKGMQITLYDTRYTLIKSAHQGFHWKCHFDNGRIAGVCWLPTSRILRALEEELHPVWDRGSEAVEAA